MNIRQATPEDYRFISQGFHYAMLMEDTPQDRIDLFAEKICRRDDVLYCYKNTIIAEVDGTPAAMLTAYDGRIYSTLRKRTFELCKREFGIEFPDMEDETCPGEYYLDSLAVWREYRGKGIGTELLKAGIGKGRALGLTVTLAVDPTNQKAQRLYQSLGFNYIDKKELFIFGHTYWKMYYAQNNNAL